MGEMVVVDFNRDPLRGQDRRFAASRIFLGRVFGHFRT
ncbi:hypothetical protein VDG1235_3040 [Verrucomicrobiia bacterium DG1235]|nr:hypothetical protein VDG1235_3040 [Verrucomicrobiae bacterium DG1235]